MDLVTVSSLEKKCLTVAKLTKLVRLHFPLGVLDSLIQKWRNTTTFPLDELIQIYILTLEDKHRVNHIHMYMQFQQNN